MLGKFIIPDILRGRKQKVTIRFNDDDLIKLPCGGRYDPELCGNNGNEVLILSKVEVENEDGSWGPYPSVAWVDPVDGLVFSLALVKKTNKKVPYIMSTPPGCPDVKLLMAAVEAKIYTE